ncbi:hypothetical protein [Pseudomonas putida]|uniref:hypothetical protein n=1 Tax=Pseudomonas putida TaxID=303 RepID=UPI0037CBB81D
MKSVFMFILALLPLPLLFWAMRYYRMRWRAGMEARFAKAVEGLQIGSHELLVDKVTVPSTDITAEVYRILRDERGRYFLYMRTGDSIEILKPLTEERALQAVKLNA